jgi:HEAT repeat protein
MLLLIVARLLLALAGFQDLGPLMWTGEGSQPLVRPADKDAAIYADSLRAELKALVTRTDIQRDYPVQLEKLDMLRGRACWSPSYSGKAEISAEIAEVRADWLEKLGRHADAVFAAQHALVVPEEKGERPYNYFIWVSSNGMLAQLTSEIDALPRMVALRKRFSPGTPAAQSGDAIEDVVRRTLESGDPTTLKDFGTRCVPALQKAILEKVEEETQFNGLHDPLTVLVGIDRRAGESVILATVGKRGPAWTLRALRALSTSGATGASWVNAADPLQPPRFDDPLTLQVIDALAAQPISAPAFFGLLSNLVVNDAISPAVEAYLLGHTQATDPMILELLRGMLDGKRCGPNKRALYEAFLESSDAELRHRSASALQFYPVGPATLRATQHSDPNVRSQALGALVRHFVTPYRYWGPGSQERREFDVPRTPEITAALLRLARDPETSVRKELVRALQESKEEPPAEVLQALLADADAEVRKAAAYDWSFKPELQARVLEALAVDKDAQVLRTVGFALNRRSPAYNNKVQQSEFQLYLPALVKWLNNPSTNVASDPNTGPKNPLQGALQTPEGARLVFDAWFGGPNKEALAPSLLEAVTWPRDRQEGTPITDALDAPRVAELFAQSCKLWQAPNPEQAQQSLFEWVSRGKLDPRPFVELARDEARPRETRVRALMIAAPKGGAEFKEAVFGLLRGESSDREFLNLLGSVLNVWPELDQARAEICADAKMPDGPALYVVGYGYRSAALDAAATRACLQRWSRLDDGWKRWDMGLFRQLDPGVDPAVVELWRSSYRVPELSYSVLSAMAKYPRDESVPLLTECVRAEWISDPASVEMVRRMAIGALTMRLDELGADALLKAISSARDDAARKQCFDGLEQIRKYQDEKQSWQQRKGGAAAREQAIADLLPMLSDKDASIRAAAARSLGTLQAVEHLPKLVALLKDKDASVREAAQKALDALNTPQPKKP